MCQLSQMSRYWCSSKAEQRVEERLKIIILLWADNSETVSVEGLSGAENSTLLLFFRESYIPGGHMEISQILQTSICILKYGKDAENCGRIWGFVSYHGSSLIFPPSCESRKQKTELPPTVRIKALRGEGAIKRHFEVDIQHISSRGVLGPHYSHVAYYTSAASTGRSRECAEPRQSQLIPSPSWQESSLACFSFALPEPAGTSREARPRCFSLLCCRELALPAAFLLRWSDLRAFLYRLQAIKWG